MLSDRTEGLHPLINAKNYGGLTLLKYKKKVFYKNLWNMKLLECRGRVVDAEGNTVSAPFTKIFNYQENETQCPLDAKVLAVRKVNGFMGAYTNGLYTTTGSFESDYVDMFKELMTKELPKGATWLFEVVHKNDPHIIREEPGVYLIGVRSLEDVEYNSTVAKEIYLDFIAEQYDFKRPEWFQTTFADVLEKAAVCEHEGFCVYSNKITSKLGSHAALKIKSPFYLKAKALARYDKPLDDDFAVIKKHLPENLSEQERLTFIFEFLKNHDFAI